MSRPGDSVYAGSSLEAADHDHGRTRSSGSEVAEAPPAEPRSRQGYAGYMRQEPAAGRDDASGETSLGYSADRASHQGDGAGQSTGRQERADHSSGSPADVGDHGAGVDHGAVSTGQTADSTHEPGTSDSAVQAQGMGRSRYADYMQQGPAAGRDDPGAARAARPGALDGDLGTSHAADDTHARGAGQEAAVSDPARESAEAPPALGVGNGSNARDGTSSAAEPSGDEGITTDSSRQQARDDSDHNFTSTADDEPRPAPPEQPIADHDPSAGPGPSERTETPAADASKPLSPEAAQLKELQAENAQARQKIAELEAKLEAKSEEQAARLDRIEQMLARTDRPAEDTSAEASAEDEPTASQGQDVSRSSHKGSDQESNLNDAERSRWRRAITAENVGAAGTLVSATETITQFAMHATPDGIVGLATTLLGLAAVGLAKTEKNRKGKDDHPDQPQG